MTDKPTKKGNTAPRGRRRKEPPEPPRSDEEIIALVKAYFPQFDPARFEPEDDGGTPLYGCGDRSFFGRRHEEWRVEAYDKVDALRDEGLSGAEACRRIHEQYKAVNVALDSFMTGYWRFKRKYELVSFNDAVVAHDIKSILKIYRRLSPEAKSKVNSKLS